MSEATDQPYRALTGTTLSFTKEGLTQDVDPEGILVESKE